MDARIDVLFTKYDEDGEIMLWCKVRAVLRCDGKMVLEKP